MAVGFGDFPPEIVAGIAEVLDASHPPSLLAFAQTSKAHYAISCRFLFRTIKITLSDTEEPEQLHREVDKWQAILLHSDAFAHVRRLIIFSADVKVEMPNNPYLALEPCERDDDPAHLQSCWDLYHCWWNPGVSEFDAQCPLPSLRNDDWRSVVHLVGQLRGLTDILYACVVQFPSCLFEKLRLELPHCRLHHFNFHLRDADDAYERALAISPCLYSIGNLDHIRDKVGWTLARNHAPQLRTIFLWASHRMRRNVAAGGFELSENASRDPVSALHHIELGKSMGLFDPDELSDFAIVARMAFNNFSALRILKLYSATDYRTLPAPEDFPSLVTLVLKSLPEPTGSTYWTAALVFARNLPRVTTLQLEDWNRAVSFVSGLSPNLRKLQVSTQRHRDSESLSCEHIHQLAILCPHLEDLAIEMRRSRGDASEVAGYRALGRLPRLRRLALKFDAHPPPIIQITKEDGTVMEDTPVEPWFDAWDAEYLKSKHIATRLYPYRKGHLLDIFVTSAIDENLARSIFAVIDGAKSAIIGGGVIPLEQLEVSAGTPVFPLTRRQGLFSSYDALRPYLQDALGQKWLVARSVRDDARHVLHAREMCHNCNCNGRSTPEGWCEMKKLRKGLRMNKEHEEADLLSKGGPFAEVWSRLWPDKGDGRPWLNSWESWPLDLGPGGQ